ncbi:MAG: OmpH family outer membrane protein [Deltaproteobacteria bacterium]|nr:OmpH family outer membrane protein [Deltaproteobacteria bacterium]MBW2069982.1 OmpH family outer membrane protein [Deltaproteobacteria bacterium]
MKKYAAFLTIFLLFYGVGIASAAEVVKLGYFDMQTIIERSEIGKQGAEKFQQQKEKVRQELSGKLKEIKALDEEFKKKEQIWSAEVKKQKAQEIMAKRMEYDRLAYDANRQLDKLQQELLNPIRDKIFDIITRIGKEEGYTMIWEMRRAGLAYAPASLELTDRIIKELNERVKKSK